MAIFRPGERLHAVPSSLKAAPGFWFRGLVALPRFRSVLAHTTSGWVRLTPDLALEPVPGFSSFKLAILATYVGAGDYIIEIDRDGVPL